jgi:hypothetical protein
VQAPERDELGRAPADPESIFRALAEHEVDYLVIGGIAVRVHGYPRTTQDVDVIPDPSRANLRRLAAALRALEARPIDERGEELPLDLSHPESLAVGNYFFSTRSGALDLFNGSRPDLRRYRRLAEASIEVKLDQLSIHIVGKDDLIRLKREAGRDKDLRDIAALTAQPSDDR